MANGNLAGSVLADIPGGRLRRDAAAAWNAGPAKAGLRPTGSRSSYRTYAEQVYFWNLYVSGRGNLAARPGTSNHGWGTAVDLAASWMRSWIDRDGARFGWRKTEAFSEWWHVNYVGGFTAPNPKPDLTRVLPVHMRQAVRLLLYRRRERRAEGRTGQGPRWRRWDRAVNRSYKRVELFHRRAKNPKYKYVLAAALKDRDGRL